MNIHFTPKEYKLLIDMLAIADWILHAHAISKDNWHPEHEELKWKIFSFAAAMGAGELVDHEKGAAEYYETMEYEQLIQDQFVTPYDESSFWDQLIDRLSERDLTGLLGEERINALTPLEHLQQLDAIKKCYLDEFAKNGLTNLKLAI